jgi:hypothetical protein
MLIDFGRCAYSVGAQIEQPEMKSFRQDHDLLPGIFHVGSHGMKFTGKTTCGNDFSQLSYIAG